jgi:hypothetical protein
MPPGIISAAELAVMSPPETMFVVEGLLPVGLGMLVAKPKMGKSFMSLELGLAVATGRPFLDRATTQGSVLYLALEDNYQRLQKREAQLRGSGPLVPNLYLTTLAPKIGPELEAYIGQWADAVGDAVLVIIDTMGRVMPEKSKGGDDYQHSTQVLGSLQRMAFERNLVVLLVHHAKKQDEFKDPFELALGSQGQFGVLDVMLVIDRPRMSGDGVLYVTGRDIDEGQHSIRFDQATGLWHATTPSLQQALDVTAERFAVLQAIKAGNSKTGDIAAAIEDGHIRKSNKYGHYELSDITRTALEAAESDESGESDAKDAVLDDDTESEPEDETLVNPPQDPAAAASWPRGN